MKGTLIVILGPTGTGKTDFAIEVAEHFGCEIISADSRQFFEKLEIGTAPPSQTQLERVPHHFVRFLPLDKYYSASLFERDVLLLLSDLFNKNNIAVMCGGSTLYIDAVCNGIDDIPDVEPDIREKYSKKFKSEGIESLRMALKMMDPVHYERVDLKNPKRIIRALEICETTGKPYSSFLTGNKQPRKFNIIKIGIRRTRDELYNRINGRVDKMIAAGLEDEARKFYHLRNFNSLDTVGYKEFFGYFDGDYDKDKAIELIKRNSRRYAKRQMTWWSRQTDVNWFDADSNERIVHFISNLLEKM